MTRYLPIHGTWGDRDDWVDRDSAFTAFMRQQGCAPLGCRPYRWSGDVGGALRLAWWRRKADWVAGGHNLYTYLCPAVRDNGETYVPIADRNLIAHSHGGQVVFYACAEGLKVNTLFTIGTPVRGDMAGIIARARPNIGYWVHVTDASIWRNKMQVFGQLFDGYVGMPWTFQRADLNYIVKGIGHSEVLRQADAFHHWLDQGWLDILKGQR